LRKLRSQPECGRCLETVGLPGCWKEGPAQSISQREIRLDAPGVLAIKLVRIEAIASVDRCAACSSRTRISRHHVAILIQVVVGDHVRNHPVQGQQRTIVLRRGLWFWPTDPGV